MKAIGYTDDLPLWRRFQLAVHDVGPRYIRDLKTEGYDKLTLDQVQACQEPRRDHRLHPRQSRPRATRPRRSKRWSGRATTASPSEYIKDMKAEGFAGTSLEDFVRTRDHGVTQAYVQGMKKAGFSSATIEELVPRPAITASRGIRAGIRGLGLTATTIDEFTGCAITASPARSSANSRRRASRTCRSPTSCAPGTTASAPSSSPT